MGNMVLIVSAMLCALISDSRSDAAIFIAAALIIAAMPDKQRKPKEPPQ